MDDDQAPKKSENQNNAEAKSNNVPSYR